MRKILIIVALMVVGLVTLKAQKLEIIGGDTHDWGVVTKVSAPLQAKIEIKNAGDKDLVVSEVRPGCGCTAAPLEKSTLKPGETTFINVSLNVGTNTGQLVKSVFINSNATNSPNQTLYLKAFIQRPIQAEPTYIAIQQMFVNKEATGSTKLKNTMKTPITITAVTADNGASTGLKTPYILQPGAEVELLIKVTPRQEQVGAYYSHVAIQTNHPDAPTIDISVYGTIKTLVQSPAFVPAGSDK